MSEYETGEKMPLKDADTLLTPMGKRATSPRAMMVRKLSDIVVLPTGQISTNERSLVADILLQIVDKVEPAIRKDLAKRVSRLSDCPPALIRALVLDDADIAQEILEHAETVPEPLLIETAHHGQTVHRTLIAGRKDLTSSVADAVLNYGEIDVIKRVLRCQDLTLSPVAVNRLVAQIATMPDLAPLLLRRPELEPAHGYTMFWWLDKERRRRILARFSLDRRLIQDALEDLYPQVFRSENPDELVKEILLLSERRHRPRGVDGEPVSAGIIIKTLASACRNVSPEIIEAVSMIAGVSRELASRVLRDPGGEPMAIMCKSLGMARDDFYEIQLVPDEDKEAGQEKADYLLGIFDSLARDCCRAILRYWDWDGNPRIAHISQLLAIAEDGIEEPSF